MADVVHKDCGPKDVSGQVRKHIMRVENGKIGRPQNPESPIVFIEGIQGRVESAELERITDALRCTAPFAQFNFVTGPPAPANPNEPRTGFWRENLALLAALVWGLSQWRPVYGALRFSRFSIGQLVQRLDLDPTLPYDDLRSLSLLELARYRNLDRLEQVLRDAVAQAPGETPDPLNWTLKALGPYGVQFVFDRLMSRAPGRRMLFGRTQSWWASQGEGDDIDVLLNLNRWLKEDAGPALLEKATKLMFAAFFADLQDNFQHRLRSGEWSFNAVLLLENVTSEWGQSFIAELATAQVEHRSKADDHADPLTVVATSRTRIPVAKTSVGRTSVAEIPVTRLLLRPRDLSTVREMFENRMSDSGGPRFLPFHVYEFTGGHPEAVDLLLEAAVAESSADAELNDLLTRQPGADARDPDREGTLLRILLPTVSDHEKEVEDLITLSAARDRDQAVRLAVKTELMESRIDDPTALAPEIWATDSVDGTLLRRLLLRRLSARGPHHHADWSTVHDALRRICQDARLPDDDADSAAEMKRRIDQLTYSLADGDLRSVATEFAASAARLHTRIWLSELHAVAVAPRRVVNRAPDEQIDELVQKTTARDEWKNKEIRTLVEIIACEWLAADPTTPGNQHGLHTRLSATYRELVDCVRNPSVITDHAAHHAKVAEQWL